MKRLNRRGSAIIEYTVILAFIASVATSFFYEDNFKDPIVHITNRVIALLGGNPNLLVDNTKSFMNVALRGDQDKQSTSYNEHVAIAGANSTDANKQLVQLDSNQEYELVIDLNGFQKAGITDIEQLGACIFLWETNNPNPKANLDSGDILFGKTEEEYSCNRLQSDTNPYKDSKVTVSRDTTNKTMTCTFTTKDKAYFGMNLTYKKNIDEPASDANMKTIADNYQKYVTLQKKTN